VGRALIACCFFSIACSFTLAGPLRAQQSDPQLDALADSLARKLRDSKYVTKHSGTPIRYVVFDFKDFNGQITQLGAYLADALSGALNDRISDLRQIERSKVGVLCNQERLENNELLEDSVASWAARTLGANLAILGTIEPRDEKFNLHLRVIDEHSKELADTGDYLNWTDERRSWDHLPFHRLLPVADKSDIPKFGRGFSEPVCIRCPQPAYTEDARKAKFQGTILVELTIGLDGHVEEVVPLRGLPYGLTRATVATVKTYQFKPPIGPDGKAVKVRITIETNFRITSFR